MGWLQNQFIEAAIGRRQQQAGVREWPEAAKGQRQGQAAASDRPEAEKDRRQRQAAGSEGLTSARDGRGHRSCLCRRLRTCGTYFQFCTWDVSMSKKVPSLATCYGRVAVGLLGQCLRACLKRQASKLLVCRQ